MRISDAKIEFPHQILKGHLTPFTKHFLYKNDLIYAESNLHVG